jgi:2-polyprenyl-3-methyl-5-hydroxy-6-metoxy-1,4-benzoquinol methylase
MLRHSTYDFVKDTKRDRYWELRKREIGFLVDPDTQQVREEFAHWVNCCVCSQEGEFLFKKEGFKFVRCKNCDLVFVNPQVKEEILTQVYEGTSSLDAWVDVLLSDANKEYDKVKYSKRIEKIESLTERGKILDIGCSIGHFLKLAQDRDWEALGIELNTRAIKYATEQLGIKVIPRKLPEADLPDNSFNAVTLWGVLEHVKNPTELLCQIHLLLKDNGILLISCPNVDSLVVRIMHEKTATFDGRNHLWYFCQDTLKKLLTKTGFEIINVESEQPELDTILNWANFDDPYLKKAGRPNKFKKLFTDQMKQEIERKICENKLGYKIVVFAKKSLP